MTKSSSISPELTPVPHSPSPQRSVFFLDKCGQRLEGFILLQNEQPTVPLPNFDHSSLLWAIPFSTGSYKKPTVSKSGVFGSRCVATAHIVCEGKNNFLHPRRCLRLHLHSSPIMKVDKSQQEASEALMVSFTLTERRHWGCWLHGKGHVNV